MIDSDTQNSTRNSQTLKLEAPVYVSSVVVWLLQPLDQSKWKATPLSRQRRKQILPT